MNFIKITIMATAVAGVALCASAQDSNDKELQKAIVIEKDFVPVETKATKTDVLPEEMPLRTQTVDLSFSDWAVPAQIAPQLARQAPIRYADSNLLPFRKRGYAMFGIGNYLNMVGSTGYRIIDNDKTNLAAWFQHNSTNGYVLPTDIYKKEYFKKQFVTDDKLGVDFSHNTRKGTFDAGLRYHYEKFNYYGRSTESDLNFGKQKVNDFNLHLNWENNNEALRYYAGAAFNYFGYSYGVEQAIYLGEDPNYLYYQNDLAKGLKEYHATVDLGLQAEVGEESFVGADAGLQILNYDYPFSWEPYEKDGNIISLPQPSNAYSFGMLSLTPYYSKQTDKVNLRIGVNLDVSFNRGTVFRIAPDVKFDLLLNDKLSLFASATGGNKINTFHETQARNRYMNPSYELPITYTLVDAVAGINLGKWKELSLSPYVGFAVKDNNMVAYQRDLAFRRYFGVDRLASMKIFPHQVEYQGVDMYGFIAGVKFGYKFKDLLDLQANYAFTPQDFDKGYILTDDSPTHSFDVSLKITPIKKLAVNIDYQLRAMRHMRYEYFYPVNIADYIYDINDLTRSYKYLERMPNISNLNLGVSYQFNDMIGVFCQANNLLNREYWTFTKSLYQQKFNFMGGVTLNF